MGGTIYIEIQLERDNLRVMVRNPFEHKAKSAKSEGHGLKTLQQRLDAVYRGKANILTNTQNGKFTITMNLPIDMEK